MQDHSNRCGTGRCAPICTHCDTATEPGPGFPIDRHEDHCPLFDHSRERRERDVAWLTARPEVSELIRRLDYTEVPDVGQFGSPPASRQQRRRWTVTARLQRHSGQVHPRRLFNYDVRPLAAIIDTAAAGDAL